MATRRSLRSSMLISAVLGRLSGASPLAARIDLPRLEMAA